MTEVAMTERSPDERPFKLDRAPIIEAVVDIDCDMPPNFDLQRLEEQIRNVFREDYPTLKKQFIQEHQIEQKPNEPAVVSARQGLGAILLFKDGALQLLQVRTNGFSFNRLAPYSSLDDYLPEIRRTWRLFVDVTSPVRVRRVVLRYINRIMLPMEEGRVVLDHYLEIGPRLPDEGHLTFINFLNQHTAIEAETGNLVKTTLTNQPAENGQLPLIFDIEAMRAMDVEPDNWDIVEQAIISLRRLKNTVFKNTLSDRCLKLFQH
jgi:uncharacterized protein (TIGR04255 family)